MKIKHRKGLSRFLNCLLIAVLVTGGLPTPIAEAASHSREAAALTGRKLISPLASNRFVAQTGLDTGTCTNPIAPCATLQYAIDQAGTSDRVLVSAGVYTEVNTYGGLAQVAYIDKTVNLRGGYSPDFNAWDPEIYTTTLDGGGLGRVLYLTGSITPTIEGFLITHGDATGLGTAPDDDAGGGIYIISATVTISGCQIVDNYAYGGGGVSIFSSTGSIFQNNLLAENQATLGSAIVIVWGQVVMRENEIVDNPVVKAGSVFVALANLTLEDNIIARNTNTGYSVGGVFVDRSAATLTNNRITGNEGAGIFLSGTTGVTTIFSNTISGNDAGVACTTCSDISILDNQVNDNGAGGIAVVFTASDVTISGNTIRGNQTDRNGGGVFLYNVNYGIITDNTITENTAQQDGGGIYIDYGTHYTITNNTIAGNQASRNGGGIYQHFTELVIISENTVANNTAGQNGGGIYSSYPYDDPVFTSNLITHNEAGGSCGGLDLLAGAELTNNLVADNSVGIGGSGMCLAYDHYTLRHNTLTNNSGGDGSGIYGLWSNTTISMTNTILVSQTVGIVVNSGVQASLDSTLWYSNTQNWSGAGSITTLNNYTGNPAFADPAAGDYHIGASSAARDVGVNAGVFTDFEGDPRPLDGGFDLGFDEYLAQVDFTLHKQAFPSRIEAGDPLTYVLTFSNQGNITATQVLITDILPVELEGYQISSTWPITPTGETPYTWQIPSLAPRAGGVITITGVISTSLPEGYVFTNTAQITTTSSVKVGHPSDDFAWAVVRTNTSPLAVQDTYSTPEDIPLIIEPPGVILNDQDHDGDTLVAILDTQPITGELSFRADGAFTYLPPSNYNGVITFTYHLSDGLANSNSALVIVNITSVNDPPLAVGDVYTITEDSTLIVSPLGVILNDYDPDGDALTAILDSQPITGELAFESDGGFSFLPSINFNGVITFTYHLSDGLANSNSATVFVNITPVNDPPVAVDDVYTITEDSTLIVSPPGVIQNDLDPDNDALTAILDTHPITGELSFQVDGGFTYRPPANYNGVITFTYYLSDGLAYSNIATVIVNITPVNDPPLAVDDVYTITEDSTLIVSPPGVILNDHDPDSDALTAILDTQPITGELSFQVDGGITYLPPANYHGVITFTYYLSDGLTYSNIALVIVNITPVNDPPLAVDDVYTITEDSALIVSPPGVILNDHDPDSDALTAILDTYPITGELSFQADGGFTYLPPVNYNGVITFTYYLSDGLAYSNIATVFVNITPVNDPPLAVDDQDTTLEDTPVAVNVLANDIDIDGDPLSLSSVGQPLHGDTLISGTLAVYTPALNFFGPDVFTYTVSDGHNGEDIGVVTITVDPGNDAPIVEAGDDQVALEGEEIAFSGSFTDDGRRIRGVETPSAGEQLHWDFGDGITATDTLTPTHVYADNGIYIVTLTITDSGGAVGQDWLIITVNNVAPGLAILPNQIIRVGQPLTITAVFTDPGWLDTHEVIIEWETGITETFSLPVGTRQFNLEHVYAQAGSYRVTIWIVDDDSGISSRNFEIVVNPWRVYLPGMRK